MSTDSDVVIIGSGIGGATLASELAPSGARILILERGEHLADTPEARDDMAIFERGFYRSDEEWIGSDGKKFLPGNYYYVGGNSKFYGAVMYRYRVEDFRARPHLQGTSPGWDMSYDDMEPWYARAEALFKVRGATGQDLTEPPRSGPFPFPPVPDEPALQLVRERLKRAGVHPASLPLAIDIDAWLKRGRTGWDAFPNTGGAGKIDAEAGPLADALKHPNVRLMTGAQVMRLETGADGHEVVAAVLRRNGREERLTARHFAVAAGAVQSAALLLRSANAAHPTGLGNRSDQLGRNFMNHNTSAMITLNPFLRNDSVYQKTLFFNDFYNDDPQVHAPLGNVQLLGRITGNILKAQVPAMPRFLARLMADRAFGWFLTSEDLPNPNSRVLVRGENIVMDWQRSNMDAHHLLIKRARQVMKRAGFPVVMVRIFGNKTTSHQCGTARLGVDPHKSVVDLDCRSHDIPNLWITDASILPTSAAVNPALTIAALALKAGEAMKNELI
ncbi:GMC family oxidoreductase [Paracoccus denitrificans]|jgi:choline dehydrogenase-like flavoprotein|uniref:Glucose-methanol-choline oxidoreductase n=1 Tax=Paracoccus denitrificans (strain Pd 1222) TaxID=318586 RepID=A1B100_PARDP|nr:GMC family oxidoreductase [Paracoccus denitrificans]ABL69194.1 glucose-methanol-choline oxidoreductase [Paracoccus denitrificans PD1222]MBB4629024.1 choline dehydrogenase-like flavoprotein [Paracoccus denitrificans]MCU7430029.1 GMC family oxidoreductase [Paracoccus denitrificans]QAR27207.1 GMC family oxidoreductase [Paracoccus denitrificans]UPV96176.1 GMC family oxidoreductase [Paracoccus denitrificans]